MLRRGERAARTLHNYFTTEALAQPSEQAPEMVWHSLFRQLQHIGAQLIEHEIWCVAQMRERNERDRRHAAVPREPQMTVNWVENFLRLHLVTEHCLHRLPRLSQDPPEVHCAVSTRCEGAGAETAKELGETQHTRIQAHDCGQGCGPAATRIDDECKGRSRFCHAASRSL